MASSTSWGISCPSSLRSHPHECFAGATLSSKTSLIRSCCRVAKLRTRTPSTFSWRSAVQKSSPMVVRYRNRRLSISLAVPTISSEEAVSGNAVSDKPQTKWNHKAIKAVCLGQLEAFRMKYLTTGTEALLLGILMEGTSFASKFLRDIGISVLKLRAEVIQMRGTPYKYAKRAERPPLTESAQKVLEWAVAETSKLGEDIEVTNIPILLGIWAQKGAAGQQLLAKFGFDDKKAEELAQLIKDEIAQSVF
eukprot:TRINITY_DN301_c0_g1_i1.p1 TRINITY_DN301_c0_g1~~TRINITY_DN301_c0_g1_i1.p1  ORF type:complete len:250 (+),score=35.50 TRINITY_DN301_c0_g1_i1:147-896(+)